MADYATKFFRGSFLKLPTLAAQLTGTFPLSISETGRTFVKLSFTWKNIGVLCTLLRIALITEMVYVIYHHRVKIENVMGDWTSTMQFAELMTQSSIIVGDTVSTVLIVYRRRRINKFLSSLGNVVTDIWKQSGTFCDTNLTKKFHELYKFIKWSFGWVATMSVINMALSNIVYVPVASEMFPEWTWGVFQIVIFNVYYEVTMHFRLLYFFLPVAILFMIYVGFGMLGYAVEHFLPDLELNWIMGNFTRLERLLKEFHLLFEFQLITGILTLLSTLLSVSFLGIAFFMGYSRGERTDLSLYEFISVVPWAISLSLIFCIVCDIATRMTAEAKECIWAFRKWQHVDDYGNDEKHKLILFYLERCTRPPQVSPAQLFTLGRHLFPTVLGMMATYLIVMYQFESDDLQES